VVTFAAVVYAMGTALVCHYESFVVRKKPESPEITYHYQAGPCHSLVVSVQSGKTG